MSTPEDKVKQNQEIARLRELHQTKNRTSDQENEYKRLLDAYRESILKNKRLLEEDKPQPQYQLDSKKKGFVAELLEDYKKETGKEPIAQPGGLVALHFDSQEDAVKFLQEQAKKNRGFDAYDKEKDHRMYSDGKGTFVHGTKVEVDAYLKNPKSFDLDKTGRLTAKEPESTKKVSPT
ncbi:hypothetical protein [Legionella clemsonensis]|uniref:Substrate of the Dot/Icm secretion system n=1 Tax=Legionella clemsonensis TaxID=1867846 RepID=A0A222P466_9GAMM|nr:hypothetical protein [Legionella clemsonensis]ASQ46644.1 hypothetical protein clem_10490 [Legionella clemsonensis]